MSWVLSIDRWSTQMVFTPEFHEENQQDMLNARHEPWQGAVTTLDLQRLGECRRIIL